MMIKKASIDHIEQLLELICELAHYEHLEPPDDGAKQRLKQDLNRRYEAFLAFEGKKAIGYAMFYYAYSSFLAKPTLYLEDIFVLEEHRGKGAGKALFEKCIEEAQRNGCGRVDFVVLKWNTSAQRFYESFGAKPMEEWILYRVSL